MKKLLILTVLFLNMIPWVENGSLTFTTPYRLMAQSMGSESPFTAGNCTILCGAGSISGPCETVNSIPCDFVTVTPTTNPPPPDPTTYTPPPSDPCSTNNPSYNPCNCGQVCGGAPVSGGGSTSKPPASSSVTHTLTVQPNLVTVTGVKTITAINCDAASIQRQNDIGNLRHSSVGDPTLGPRPLSTYFDQIKGGACGSNPNETGFIIGTYDGTLSEITIGPILNGTSHGIIYTGLTGSLHSNGVYTGTIAFVHTHPNAGNNLEAPSADDFYTLATSNITQNMTGAVDMYALNCAAEYNLHVVDRTKLAAFLAKYPRANFLDADGNFKGALFDNMQNDMNTFMNQGYNKQDAYTYAFAKALQVGDAGVMLYRNIGDGVYKQINITISSNSVTITKCK